MKHENEDEIKCPHCDYEFSDSWECIPSGDGELCWDETCPECNKEFDVVFDARNIDDGYTTSVKKCKDGKHNYVLKNSFFTSNYKSKNKISPYSRVEVCSICDNHKFIPIKPNGSDFTEKELTDFRLKKRLEKKNRMYFPYDGKKQGSFEIRNVLDITLKLKEAEGNIKIWVDFCRFMQTKGFKSQTMPDYLRRFSVSLKKGFVECDISINNYALTINFYQNKILKDRKAGDGRYDYNKYNVLTPEMKTIMRGYVFIIKKYLSSEGFEYKESLKGKALLLERLNVKSLNEWKDPNTGDTRDYLDADKKSIKSGDLKYFYDYKTLKRGIIWWNNGNQWFVLHNGKLTQTAHFRLFDYNNHSVKKALNEDAQIQRLYSELKKNEKNHNYDRCKALWNLIESYKLYNVWSLKHNLWWGSNNGGYTKDITKAGVYTHENITKNKNYYNDGINSKIVPIK